MNLQRLATANPLQDQPARFDLEDLAHLRCLLSDTSPRPTAPSQLASEDNQGVHQPARISIQTREEKQRAKYRNRYHNRIATLQRLKDEVGALEAVLHKLSDPDQSAKDINERSFSTEFSLTPGTTREDILDNLRHASILKQHLQRERAQLRQQFIESCDRWRSVRDLVAMHHKLYVATQSSFAMVKPVAISECAQLRQLSANKQEEFLQRHSQLNESICGWRATRCIQDGVLSFSIKKTFFNRSMDSFVPIIWRYFSDPKQYGSIFAPSLEMQVRAVQHIDSDNVVMLSEYVETSDNGERIKVKALWLLTRAWTENGYFLGIHGLGNDRLAFLEHPQPRSSNERIVWNDQCTWVRLERGGAKGEHTTMQTSGCVRLLGKDIDVWFKQLYQGLIQWDTLAFGNRFSIPKQ